MVQDGAQKIPGVPERNVPGVVQGRSRQNAQAGAERDSHWVRKLDIVWRLAIGSSGAWKSGKKADQLGVGGGMIFFRPSRDVG